MEFILDKLQYSSPKSTFELKNYTGKDKTHKKMQKAKIGCYSLFKNGKDTGVVLYEFSDRGTEEEIDIMVETITKLIKLKAA